jgi:linoleoyl-CoA desaturase
MVIPKFLNPTNSFHAELRKRINHYFDEIKAKPTGNAKLYTKAIIIFSTLIITYVHLVFYTSPNWIVLVAECLLLGLATAAIGFNIMHDGAHGSFSNKKWLNELAGMSLNILGANVFMWKTKHNVVHHTYTNIDGVDDDIDARPFLRLCESQKKYKIHKFQYLYFPFAYSLLYLYWIFFTDYEKYFTKKVGNMPLKKLNTNDHITFWAFKILHAFLFIVIPIIFVGFKMWIIGFLIFGFFTGIVISLVFQLAHTVESTHFPKPDESTGKVQDEWAVHQIKTTANFATNNKIVSWFTGGLNFQVEHHLFPNISHIHYPKISKIVKDVCKEYNVTYNEYNNVVEAINSHVSHLRNMGVA